MSDRKGGYSFHKRPFIHFFPSGKWEVWGLWGTGTPFAIASGRPLKVIHQNRFHPFPELSPAQLSWCCCRDELAGISHWSSSCKSKRIRSIRPQYLRGEAPESIFRWMHWCFWHGGVRIHKHQQERGCWDLPVQWIETTCQLFTVLKHLIWSWFLLFTVTKFQCCHRFPKPALQMLVLKQLKGVTLCQQPHYSFSNGHSR